MVFVVGFNIEGQQKSGADLQVEDFTFIYFFFLQPYALL